MAASGQRNKNGLIVKIAPTPKRHQSVLSWAITTPMELTEYHQTQTPIIEDMYTRTACMYNVQDGMQYPSLSIMNNYFLSPPISCTPQISQGKRDKENNGHTTPSNDHTPQATYTTSPKHRNHTPICLREWRMKNKYRKQQKHWLDET